MSTQMNLPNKITNLFVLLVYLSLAVHFYNPFVLLSRQMNPMCLIYSVIGFQNQDLLGPILDKVTQGQIVVFPPHPRLKLSSKLSPSPYSFVDSIFIPTTINVIMDHKRIKLASNYTFPIYRSMFMHLRNTMILSDKLSADALQKPIYDVAYFHMKG